MWLLLALTACGSGDNPASVPAAPMADGLPGPFAGQAYLQQHVQEEQQKARAREARLQDALRQNQR